MERVPSVSERADCLPNMHVLISILRGDILATGCISQPCKHVHHVSSSCKWNVTRNDQDVRGQGQACVGVGWAAPWDDGSHLDTSSSSGYSTSHLAPFQHALKISGGCPKSLGPSTHVGHSEGVPGSQLWISSALAIAAI